jgi:hypothetical protein
MAMAGGAHAAILSGGVAGGTPNTNPELFLAVWDNSGTSAKTLLADISVDSNFDFNTGIGPKTIDLSTFGAITTLSYAVLAAGDNGNTAGDFAGLWFTASSGFSGTIFQGSSAINELVGNIGRIGSLTAAQNTGAFTDDNTTVATSGNGVIPGGLAFDGVLIDLTTSAVPVGGASGTPLDFYNSLFNAATGLVTTTKLGSWLLSGNALTYTPNVAPIPLPAGVWLLGSAVLGLVGIGRRRQQRAVA